MLNKEGETSISSPLLVSGNKLPHKILKEESFQVTYKTAVQLVGVVYGFKK